LKKQTLFHAKKKKGFQPKKRFRFVESTLAPQEFKQPKKKRFQEKKEGKKEGRKEKEGRKRGSKMVLEIHYLHLNTSILVTIFGVAALFLVFDAYKRLTTGMLRSLLKKIFVAILFFFLHSLTHAGREALELNQVYGDIIELPEYVLMILGIIALFLVSKDAYKIGKTFGFKKKTNH